MYIHCNNDVTKEGDGGAMESAFLCFHKKLEDLSDVEHLILG